MNIVEDIDRPDTGGTLPKMHDVCEKAKTNLNGLAIVLNIFTDDNLMSSISIRGSFDPKEEWENGIFQNSRHFIFAVVPMKGKRYYNPDDPKVTVTLDSAHYDLTDSFPFRKYTGPVDKMIAKVQEWLKNSKEIK